MRSDDWITKLYMEDQFSKPLYYLENSKIVFTDNHHINRGTCCGSGCRHCPYEPKHKKGNITLQDIYTKRKE